MHGTTNLKIMIFKISVSHKITGSGSCVVSSHHLMTVLNIYQYLNLMN